ncbi:MAG: DNA recombination protein RmuC [Actinobacteria bacterium]|nr:DNA recombination protein RmuC [Actinomycetota bacterium]
MVIIGFIFVVLKQGLNRIVDVQKNISEDFKYIQANLGDRFEKQGLALCDLKNKVEYASKEQGAIQRQLEQALLTVEQTKTFTLAGQKIDEANRLSLKRLESVIAGTYSKGKAGENILGEAFKIFPSEMMANQFQVNGKVVEFGLVLVNGKKLSIDSKWPATSILEELENKEDEEARRRIINQIESEVCKRIREVSQYIDPLITLPWAVVTIPDSAFAVLRQAHFEAYKNNVILISYSMTIPYLLTFYSLHLQYYKTLEIENLEGHIIDVQRHLDEMRTILENKIIRSVTTIQNAASEYQQLIANAQGSLTFMRSVKGEIDEN